jgi:hypothetical protein
MSVFERLDYPYQEVLDDLTEELLYTDFLKDLAFCAYYDHGQGDPYIEVSLDYGSEELDEHLISIYYHIENEEFYYWMSVELEGIELGAKVYIEDMVQLVAVLNHHIRMLLGI